MDNTWRWRRTEKKYRAEGAEDMEDTRDTEKRIKH